MDRGGSQNNGPSQAVKSLQVCKITGEPLNVTRWMVQP